MMNKKRLNSIKQKVTQGNMPMFIFLILLLICVIFYWYIFLAAAGIIIALVLIFIFRANICNTFTNVGKYLWNKTPIEVKEFFTQLTQNQNSQTSQSISQQNRNSCNNSENNFYNQSSNQSNNKNYNRNSASYGKIIQKR